MSKVN